MWQAKMQRKDKVLKDANEKEVADVKEKRSNVWCDLALTLDATTLMLIRYDSVGDDSIGDEAKAWKLSQERFQSVATPSGDFGDPVYSTAAR